MRLPNSLGGGNSIWEAEATAYTLAAANKNALFTSREKGILPRAGCVLE